MREFYQLNKLDSNIKSEDQFKEESKNHQNRKIIENKN
jgi:hypothetical protein